MAGWWARRWIATAFVLAVSSITDSGLIVAGSEVGLADVDTDTIIRSGRLGPGQMILLDLERNRLIEGEELDRYFDDLSPYSELIEDIPLEAAATPVTALEKDELTRLQRGFGYTREEVKMVVAPMALEGKEAMWSMGDDTPIAPLAHSPRPLYGFFRQRFAQVTNPPIDSLRESCVVSLRTRLGPWPHLLDKHAPVPGLVCRRRFFRSDRWRRCMRAVTRCAISSLWRTSIAPLPMTPR